MLYTVNQFFLCSQKTKFRQVSIGFISYACAINALVLRCYMIVILCSKLRRKNPWGGKDKTLKLSLTWTKSKYEALSEMYFSLSETSKKHNHKKQGLKSHSCSFGALAMVLNGFPAVWL